MSPSLLRFRAVAFTAADIVAAVALSTGAVAALERLAPAARLGIVYLLGVLFVAFRRGGIAALATAILSVLALNFFFIEPRHHLTIADSRNVVVLTVLLIAGIVVSRLAAAARQRARESELRAELAAVRERESSLLASVASALLSERGDARVRWAEGRGEAVIDGSGLRLGFSSAPSAARGETAVRLAPRDGTAWLYAPPGSGWSREALDRIAEPLARLLDVAGQREEAQRRTADADAARRADVAKTAVLHAISHDLRSPLTSITTAVGALQPPGVSSDDRAELLSVLSDESARLARLVDDLLDLSRIEAGAVDPQPDWCDLRDTVLSAAEHVRAKHGEPRIEFALADDLPLVRADAAQMERVFSNLIDNAFKFSPPGAPVRVSAACAGGHVTVRVTDRGRGIPPQARAHVFEPFFRGRGDHSGSGLGLTICRGFAEANGAALRVHARRDVGTSFTVSFPLVPQPSAPV